MKNIFCLFLISARNSI